MDKQHVVSSLGGAFPVRDSSMNDLLMQLSVTDESLFPPIMLVFPQYYQDRSGTRVDICGTIDTNTIEYKAGFRYFDINATFFRGDGSRNGSEEHVDDLCSTIKLEDLNSTDKPLSPYMWVHPQHTILKTFFKPIIPDGLISPSRHYLNRMGFVIEITGRVDSGEVNPLLFSDAEGKRYSADGHLVWSQDDEDRVANDEDCANITSMHDLVCEIKNWKLFSKQDWSTDRLSSFQEQESDIPELFNPVIVDRHGMMKELLSIMMRAQDLAKQLGIDVGFHINAEDGA